MLMRAPWAHQDIEFSVSTEVVINSIFVLQGLISIAVSELILWQKRCRIRFVRYPILVLILVLSSAFSCMVIKLSVSYNQAVFKWLKYNMSIKSL
jgi:hypothetical protein